MNPFVHPIRGPLHLGRPHTSPRTKATMTKAFALHDFLSSLPAPLEAFDNTNGVTDWNMLLNDSEGDCTCATCGHMITAWTGGKLIPPDSAIQTAYEQACGYNPANPLTDQGGNISTVLNYFRDTGIGGYKISAHAEVNLTQVRIQQTVQIFGASDLGIELPLSAQKQVGGTWDFVNNAPDAPNSWGGHSVPVVKYDADGVWVVTWGALQMATWRWFMYYVDEAQACISPNWKSPVPVADLVSDLQAVGN